MEWLASDPRTFRTSVGVDSPGGRTSPRVSPAVRRARAVVSTHTGQLENSIGRIATGRLRDFHPEAAVGGDGDGDRVDPPRVLRDVLAGAADSEVLLE